MTHDTGNIEVPSWRSEPGATSGTFLGEGHRSDVSVFVVDMAPGRGPRLHRHPYSETFVVLGGRGRFRLDGRDVEAAEGDVVVAPARAPHGFTSLGPENLRLVAIHAAPSMDTEWLE
jgi:quercetin dioxygenase-like cupin family protein